MSDISKYLNGHVIYGDDFDKSEIEAWFHDEEEGYADLGAKDSQAYAYSYHALNLRHGFRFIRNRRFNRLLGFGSAYGDELQPVIKTVDHVTIIDPSAAFSQSEIFGTPATYVKPMPDGTLPLETDAFDLATCLGVLHHIPNVSFVMKELSRVIESDGYMLLREPIVSMGDWRNPRRGLTKHERGIPIQLLRSIAEKSGFEVIHQSLCMFPITPLLFKWCKSAPYNSELAVLFDSVFSAAFAWNVNYHPTNALQRFRPTNAFLVLRKKGQPI